MSPTSYQAAPPRVREGEDSRGSRTSQAYPSAVAVRVLFLSDTHLGLDLPSRPRVVRPRRGDELVESVEQARLPATSGEAELVVHGGDLFYRGRIPAWL